MKYLMVNISSSMKKCINKLVRFFILIQNALYLIHIFFSDIYGEFVHSFNRAIA